MPFKYVLLTEQETYFVEYLLNQLILCDSISEAMVFDSEELAKKFKTKLYVSCGLNYLHKPHPGNIVKQYVIKQILEKFELWKII